MTRTQLQVIALYLWTEGFNKIPKPAIAYRASDMTIAIRLPTDKRTRFLPPEEAVKLVSELENLLG